MKIEFLISPDPDRSAGSVEITAEHGGSGIGDNGVARRIVRVFRVGSGSMELYLREDEQTKITIEVVKK